MVMEEALTQKIHSFKDVVSLCREMLVSHRNAKNKSPGNPTEEQHSLDKKESHPIVACTITV